MHSIKHCAIALLFALAAVPALAADADLVSVTTSVSQPTANPGGADEGTVLINNITNADVRVRMDLRVVFSDGTVQRLTGIADPGVLPPGGGFFLSVYFVIPTNASLGPATFIAEITATSGGLQEHETSSAAFEVVAP
jgi:hypothetical protein